MPAEVRNIVEGERVDLVEEEVVRRRQTVTVIEARITLLAGWRSHWLLDVIQVKFGMEAN